MNRHITYQAASTVAESVAKHFAFHLAAAKEHGEQDLAPEPSEQAIRAIIDTAFWASLQREEGYPPKISLALLPPERTDRPLLFEKRLPLKPATLTKLAPGVERPGIHLGVWEEQGELYLWGATRSVPSLCFVLDVPEPGLLVVKHRRLDGFGKFANVVVLNGDQIKIVDEQSASLPDCPDLLTSLLGFSSPVAWAESVNVLVQLAVSMRAHKRGGTLLVVPHGTDTWRESFSKPMSYAVTPAYFDLAELISQEADERNDGAWQEAVRRAVDAIAGFTAVDGATVISDKYELLAFGAKIVRPSGRAQVDEMVVTEPVVGGGAMRVQPALHGGTRHLSAAQFVHDQQNALALVASQDGRFTIFAWSPCEGMVHAHRIDALLL